MSISFKRKWRQTHTMKAALFTLFISTFDTFPTFGLSICSPGIHFLWSARSIVVLSSLVYYSSVWILAHLIFGNIFNGFALFFQPHDVLLTKLNRKLTVGFWLVLSCMGHPLNISSDYWCLS